MTISPDSIATSLCVSPDCITLDFQTATVTIDRCLLPPFESLQLSLLAEDYPDDYIHHHD